MPRLCTRFASGIGGYDNETTASDGEAPKMRPAEQLVEAELFVEDGSIDRMCGVH